MYFFFAHSFHDEKKNLKVVRSLFTIKLNYKKIRVITINRIMKRELRFRDAQLTFKCERD